MYALHRSFSAGGAARQRESTAEGDAGVLAEGNFYGGEDFTV